MIHKADSTIILDVRKYPCTKREVRQVSRGERDARRRKTYGISCPSHLCLCFVRTINRFGLLEDAPSVLMSVNKEKFSHGSGDCEAPIDLSVQRRSLTRLRSKSLEYPPSRRKESLPDQDTIQYTTS